jgi:hypothetical protein
VIGKPEVIIVSTGDGSRDRRALGRVDYGLALISKEQTMQARKIDLEAISSLSMRTSLLKDMLVAVLER